MPASVADPIESQLRLSLSGKQDSSVDVTKRLQASCSRVLATRIEFEQAPVYQPTILHGLKNKFIILKPSCSPVSAALIKARPELVETKTNNNNNKDPFLPTPKLILFPRESVKLGWQGRYRVGSGLNNVGNSCYLNASLQALFHIPSFVNWLHADKTHKDKCSPPNQPPACIICAMASTMMAMQRPNNTAMRPLHITSKLKLIGKSLQHGSQEDAHEFMRLLIECMEKAFVARYRGNNLDVYSKETTPLNQIFGGYMRSEVQCSSCRAVSTTFQHFQDLQLDIHRASSVTEALRQYFCMETLASAYNCASCRQEVQATKRVTMERSPVVLFLQLKRFTAQGSKLNKPISVPMFLDAGNYLHKKLATKSLSYKLTSVVTHYGNTANSGHYTAIAQTSQQQLYTFDDSCVSPLHTISNCAQHAYVIMYEMCGQVAGAQRVATPSNNVHRVATPSNNVQRVATPMNGKIGDGRLLTPMNHGQANNVFKQVNGNKFNGQSSNLLSGVSTNGSMGGNTPKISFNFNANRTLGPSPSLNRPSTILPSASKALGITSSPSKAVVIAPSVIKSLEVTPSPSKSATVAASVSKPLTVTPSASKPLDTSLNVRKSLADNSSRISYSAGKVSTPKKCLVPYEQDSSSESECGAGDVVKDASGGGWNVTEWSRSASPELEEGEIRTKKSTKRKFEGEHKTSLSSTVAVAEKPRDNGSVLGYLSSQSHRGLGGHVNSWSGGRSNVDQADFSKRPRDSDRDYDEQCDRGRVKKVKRHWDDFRSSQHGFHSNQHGSHGKWRHSKYQGYSRNHWNMAPKRSREYYDRD